MQKLWALFCLGLVFTSVYSQTCADTSSLRTYYGFDDTISTATTQTGVNFCKSIKTSPVCCTASDMNSFQTKSDAAITTLTQQAAARDTSFAQIGGQNPAAVQASLKSAVATLNTAVNTKGGGLAAMVRQANSTGLLKRDYAGFGSFSKNVNPINAASPSNPVVNGKPLPGRNNRTRVLQDIGSNSASTSVNVFGVLDNLDAIQAQLANASAAVTSSVGDFQAARANCVIELYKVQAASWCLACDVAATTKGYDPTRLAFTMGSDVCTRLKNACYPYLTASNLQNSAFNQQMLIASLNYATQQINNNANPLGSSFNYDGQQPASMPDGCTSADSCNWICTNLFNNGQVNTAALINGGAVASTSSRLLEGEVVEQSALRPRQLSSGTFNPSADEAGTTVAFAADPAGITRIINNNGTNATDTGSGSGSGKSGMLTYGSVAGGMIAMIWSMMM